MYSNLDKQSLEEIKRLEDLKKELTDAKTSLESENKKYRNKIS
jgi:hypothetical protein